MVAPESTVCVIHDDNDGTVLVETQTPGHPPVSCRYPETAVRGSVEWWRAWGVEVSEVWA